MNKNSKLPRYPKVRLPKLPKTPAAPRPMNHLRCSLCNRTFKRVGMEVGPHKDPQGNICNGVALFEGTDLS
jgi:hypothetical protein